MAVLLGGVFIYALRPASAHEDVRAVTIQPGEGIREIVGTLAQSGVIRSAAAMKLWILLSLNARALKPGSYAIDRALTTPQIVELLKSGIGSLQTVLIPEGLSLREIEERLATLHVLAVGELTQVPWEHLRGAYPFLADATTLEGFLFPDTYRFSFYEPPEVVVRAFLDTFAKKAWPSLQVSQDPYRILIIASLLEKEVRTKEEQQLVAGIIEKRLRENMPLQIDASVLYARCVEQTGNGKCGALGKSDFEMDSPFNTYRYKGLPPTPISNPGEQSIEAAKNPKASSYWFYLTNPATGHAIFANTLEEQAKNRARYLGL